jgi:membrane-bound lytic murein transglycosylase D
MQSIAKHYGVSVKQILASSSLKSNRVKAGQLLTISSVSEDTKASKHQARESRTGKSGHEKTSSSHIKSKSHTKSTSVKHKHHK